MIVKQIKLQMIVTIEDFASWKSVLVLKHVTVGSVCNTNKENKKAAPSEIRVLQHREKKQLSKVWWCPDFWMQVFCIFSEHFIV